MYSKVVSSGPIRPARAPPSMLMLQIVIRCSIDSARMASPRYSNTWPVPPPMPIRAIRARMMSLAATPGRSRPSTRTSYVRGLRWSSVWVARTISTSLVPMPNASAPNAPCVAVCESPHTIVIPGWVRPSSGPMTWTMPWVSLPKAWIGTPKSRQLVSSRLICAAAWRSTIGRPRGVVGVPWSAVATVLSGRRTVSPLLAQAGEGLGAGDLVDEVQVDGEDGGRAGVLGDDVLVPDLVDEGAGSGHGGQGVLTAVANGRHRVAARPRGPPGLGRAVLPDRGSRAHQRGTTRTSPGAAGTPRPVPHRETG